MKSKIKLRFSKAHHVAGIGIINSMKSYHYSVDRPNSILFSAYVSLNYETSSKIDAKIAALPETYRMPMDYSPDSGKHGIPAKHAIVFLDFLITLTKDHADTLYVSKNDLDSFMRDLISNGHLTPTQVGYYTGKIPVVYDIEDMVEDAKTHRDAGLALKLAQLYKEKGSTSSHIYWLNQAKTFNGSHPFFAAPENVAASLKGIESANLRSLFCDGDSASWLLDKIAVCPTFKQLEFGVFFDPYCINEKFADFLAKSQSISTLEMGSVWSADARMRMTAKHARTLAGALRLNKSVESLDVSDQRIGDEGLIALVDALVANPETKLKNLNIFCSGITEHGAAYLLKNIDKIPSLRTVNLNDNHACNKATINAVDVALAARKAQVATPAASAGTKVAKYEGKTDVASKKEENTYNLSSAGIGGIIQPALSPTGQLHKAMPHLGGWYNFGEQGFALQCDDENEAKSISEKLSKIFSGIPVNVSYKKNPSHLTFVMINFSKKEDLVDILNAKKTELAQLEKDNCVAKPIYGCVPVDKSLSTMYWENSLVEILEFISMHTERSQKLFTIYTKNGSEAPVLYMTYDQFKESMDKLFPVNAGLSNTLPNKRKAALDSKKEDLVDRLNAKTAELAQLKKNDSLTFMPGNTFLSALLKFIPTQEERDSYCNQCRDFPKVSEAQVLTSIAVAHFACIEENYKVAMEVMLCVENLNLMFAASGYAEIANLLIERNKLSLSGEKTSLVKSIIATFSDESKLYQLGLVSYGVYNEIEKLRPLLLEAINFSKKPTFFAAAIDPVEALPNKDDSIDVSDEEMAASAFGQGSHTARNG